MSDAIAPTRCACGWPRPLIAITDATGRYPDGSLRVSYDCPQCGRVHRCGEVALSTALESGRARELARKS